MRTKRFRRHRNQVIILEKPKREERLYSQKANFPLNIAQVDRISFSISRNKNKEIKKIENISYEIYVNGVWEWVVRYDDHGGLGILHRHVRISLKDNHEIETHEGIKKYKNKNSQLTWVINDIKRNYLYWRKRLVKNTGIDLY